jgi:hypothetical protein
MHIYIDESGIFRNPANKTNIASCVAALAVPTTKKKELFKKFKDLTVRWRDSNGEVKGKNLDEDQIAMVIALLKKFDVILELIIIDLGLHPEDEITKFKQIQSDMITEHITPDHHPDLVKKIKEIQVVFANMPNQLFIQAILMFMLIPRVLFHMVLYYARRIPEELQWFYWMVDAKDANKTAVEDAWSTALFPIMAGQAAKNPIALVEGGDYSYWEKFYEEDNETVRKVEKEKGLQHGALGSIKLWEVLGTHFEFQDSRWNVGLQMADILANAAQRALNRKLKLAGWRELGALMIRRNPNSVKFVQIDPNFKEGDDPKRVVKSPFYAVLRIIQARTKSMWLDAEGEARLREKNWEKNAARRKPPGYPKIDLSGLP